MQHHGGKVAETITEGENGQGGQGEEEEKQTW